MDLTKSQEFFQPSMLKEKVHIIGCGSVGSTVAELLIRLGITSINLYDFDTVSEHNLANQMYFNDDVKKEKVIALKEMLLRINPLAEANIKLYPDGWKEDTKLNGYVFLCVDDIDLRRKIAMKERLNRTIKAMFDFRTRLTDAQHYAANWSLPKDIENFIKSMNFTNEEARKETPLTACNVEMGVASTVRVICSYGVNNFINFVKTKQMKKIIIADAFNFDVDAY